MRRPSLLLVIVGCTLAALFHLDLLFIGKGRRLKCRWWAIKDSSKEKSISTSIINNIIKTNPLTEEVYEVGLSYIVNMTKHAWDAYEPFLGIADKAVLVSPPTKDNLTTMNDFGKESISLTAIAAMDTLLLMGLYNEYVIARNHILSNLKYEQNDASIPTFRAVSEILGGLLGAYALSGDGGLLSKAKELGDRLLNCTNSQGIPLPRVNFDLSKSLPPFEKIVPLNNIGGLSLDLLYLSDASGDNRYGRLAIKLTEHMRSAQHRQPNIFAEEIELQHHQTQPWNIPLSIGYKAGPAYEYLIKDSLYTAGRDLRALNNAKETAETIRKTFFDHYAKNHQIVKHVGYVIQNETDQSTCFALGVVAQVGVPPPPNDIVFWRRMKLLAENCLEKFILATNNNDNTKVVNKEEVVNLETLRPRLVESLVVLWRLTKDPAYRKMGLKMVEVIDRKWRCSKGFQLTAGGGGGGIKFQPAFLLADTFKHLYLLFAPSSLLSLDDYVFNTAGHPYPINKERPNTGTNEPAQETIILDATPNIVRRRVRVLQARIPPKRNAGIFI